MEEKARRVIAPVTTSRGLDSASAPSFAALSDIGETLATVAASIFATALAAIPAWRRSERKRKETELAQANLQAENLRRAFEASIASLERQVEREIASANAQVASANEMAEREREVSARERQIGEKFERLYEERRVEGHDLRADLTAVLLPYAVQLARTNMTDEQIKAELAPFYERIRKPTRGTDVKP